MSEAVPEDWSSRGGAHIRRRRRGSERPSLTNAEIKEQLDAVESELRQLTEEHLPRIRRLIEGRRDEASNREEEYASEEEDEVPNKLYLEKQFYHRESLLTELFRSTHIKTIYNFFLAILGVLIVNSFISDILDQGKLNLSFDMIWWCFGRIPIVITLWVGMFFSTIIILYPAFNFWAYIKSPPKFIDSFFWIVIYSIYVGSLLYFPNYYMRAYELPIASSLIVACEQVRLFMKVHAFVRENINRALAYKSSAGRDCPSPCPDFDKFLYFLFVPTLVYRDEYPRTKKTDWNFVASNFAQVLGSLFYCYYVLCRFCVPVFHNFNREHITLRTFVLATFSSILPGALCLLLLFWTLLHAWMNAFAEMLRFGDRLFYKDWWNSTSWAGYYRTWNAIVHDWLYAYIYRDVNWIIRSESRVASAMTVFLLSAVVHEYFIICALRFFYPVLFILFAIVGVFFFFITKTIRLHRAWNVAMWFNLMIGNGMLMALYSMEWYARKNCPPVYDGVLDMIVPRSWTCQANSTEVIAGRNGYT